MEGRIRGGGGSCSGVRLTGEVAVPAAELVDGFVAAVADVFGGAAAVVGGELVMLGGELGVDGGGRAEADGGVLLDAAAAVADEGSDMWIAHLHGESAERFHFCTDAP